MVFIANLEDGNGKCSILTSNQVNTFWLETLFNKIFSEIKEMFKIDEKKTMGVFLIDNYVIEESFRQIGELVDDENNYILVLGMHEEKKFSEIKEKALESFTAIKAKIDYVRLPCDKEVLQKLVFDKMF